MRRKRIDHDGGAKVKLFYIPTFIESEIERVRGER